MQRALDLAAQGEGWVEPNPMVGCVVVRDQRMVGEGWHERFGHAHAEVLALQHAGAEAQGADLYVTLEPCSHHGKTPPCVDAIVRSGVRRVIAAVKDPHPQVAGRGLEALRKAGIAVSTGLLGEQAACLIAPYWKRLATATPWVIGKWAMSLDGKIAACNRRSRWISGEESRREAHRLRGRVDAILVGRGTAEADDPQLTARPPGARQPLRVVVDSRASLSPSSRLARTASEIPVLLAAGPEAGAQQVQQLRDQGCEVWIQTDPSPAARLSGLLAELARRDVTNLLVEGGGQLLGALRDLSQLNELHVFIAPRLIGGERAISPVAGDGAADMNDAWRLDSLEVKALGQDVYWRCRTSCWRPPLES